MHFLRRTGLVFHAPGDHGHFARAQVDVAVAQVDAQLACQHDEGLVGVGMGMPDELAVQLDQLELVVVHLGDDLGHQGSWISDNLRARLMAVMAGMATSSVRQ